jgi:quercetin dioxygenase-like cupin family protein/heme-degrading monooxygenase HmoA
MSETTDMATDAAKVRSLGARVMRPADLSAHDRGSGARTTPLVTIARGATAFLNGITWFDPGAVIAHHRHNVTESVMVVHGAAIVDIDGTRIALGVFDTTLVPGNVPHHFENASADSPMAIFWTYASVEATRTIESTNATSRIDAEASGEEGVDAPLFEVATIRVKEGKGEAFERAVKETAPLFQAARGARSLTLDRSHEDPSEYRLVIGWDKIEDHIEHFRESDAFRRWRESIADVVDGTPRVAHFRNVLTAF